MATTYSQNIRAQSEHVKLTVEWAAVTADAAAAAAASTAGVAACASPAHAAPFLRLRRMEDHLASDPVYVAAVRALFLEYFNGMGIDMTFQNVAAELDNLPGAKYSADAGGFLYLLESVTAEREGDAAAVVADGEAAAGITLAGCIALRDLGSGIAEAKRLYVRPAWRGRDLGRLLLVQIIDVARQAGYATIRLDTLARFKAANAIYAKLGFQRIDPYNYNPEADVLYFELPGLQSSDRCYTQGRERYFCEVPNAHPTPSPVSSPNPDVESATPTPCH